MKQSNKEEIKTNHKNEFNTEGVGGGQPWETARIQTEFVKYDLCARSAATSTYSLQFAKRIANEYTLMSAEREQRKVITNSVRILAVYKGCPPLTYKLLI